MLQGAILALLAMADDVLEVVCPSFLSINAHLLKTSIRNVTQKASGSPTFQREGPAGVAGPPGARAHPKTSLACPGGTRRTRRGGRGRGIYELRPPLLRLDGLKKEGRNKGRNIGMFRCFQQQLQLTTVTLPDAFIHQITRNSIMWVTAGSRSPWKR